MRILETLEDWWMTGGSGGLWRTGGNWRTPHSGGSSPSTHLDGKKTKKHLTIWANVFINQGKLIVNLGQYMIAIRTNALSNLKQFNLTVTHSGGSRTSTQ